jgi:hypothetical protein
MSATVGLYEPFSHSSAVASRRSEVRTVPPFSDYFCPASSQPPEDNGCEDHNFFQEQIMVLGRTFCHAYARLKTTSLIFVRFRHSIVSSFWLIKLHRRLFLSCDFTNV